MAKTLYLSIKKSIGVDHIFSIPDIDDLIPITPGALKEELSRLAKKGQIQRVAYGLYIIPSGLLTEDDLNDQFIRYRYLKHGKSSIGFFCGEGYIGSLLNSPTPKKDLEIASNKVTSGKKAIYQYGRKITLRKPYVRVTNSNVELVAFLTYLSHASPADLKKNYTLLANHVRESHLAAPDAVDLLPNFPGKTSRILLSSGLYKLMWKH